MAVINLKNCQIEICGASRASQKIVVKVGNGNLTYEEKIERQYIKDRGNLDTVRNGDDVPLSVKFACEYEYITGAGVVTTFSFEDALKQRGGANAWVSTSPDLCEPYCVDIYFFNLASCGGLTPETLIFPMFRHETLSHDPKAGTISCDGHCNVTQATATRGTTSS